MLNRSVQRLAAAVPAQASREAGDAGMPKGMQRLAARHVDDGDRTSVRFVPLIGLGSSRDQPDAAQNLVRPGEKVRAVAAATLLSLGQRTRTSPWNTVYCRSIGGHPWCCSQSITSLWQDSPSR